MKIVEKISTITQKVLLKINFSSSDYWEFRYKTEGNSGVGSYGEKCQVKADAINQNISELGIRSVIELGSGDGNQLKYYKIPAYLGLDVSPTSIHRCHEIFKNDSSKSFFHYSPNAFYNKGDVFKADATFSIEVIFHLVEDAVFNKYMEDLFSCSEKYVFIFSSNHNNNVGSSIHVKHRKFSDYIDANLKNWKLLKQVPVHTKEEGHFNDLFIFEKKQ